MSVPVSQEIYDLKQEFEGGTSLTVDWYSLLRRGAQSVLDNINPETLKRAVPIYGGVTRNLQIYFCPADLEVPERLYTHDRTRWFDYVPPAQFYYKRWERNVFTIESINGARYIVVRHPVPAVTITLDPMDGTSTNTLSGVALTQNKYNVLPGATASMQGTFSDTANEVDITLASAVDISGLLNGIVALPVYIDSAEILGDIELQLQTDASNYYKVISTQDTIGNYLRDGQNMVRFWLPHATKTGTPTATNITKAVIKIPMTAGNSQTVVLGKLTVQQSYLFFLNYYSNYLFIDGSTGAWKDTPASGDLINVNRDTRGILHYETARLVVQAAAIDRVNAPEAQRFDTELSRKYAAYFRDHPSSAQPVSYNISPNVAHHLDPYYGGLFEDDLPDMIGNNTDSEQALQPPVYFADAETPQGVFDGTNKTFTLAHAPSPAASLQLALNGVELTYGQDYTVGGKIITMATAYSSAYASLPFIAYYRYTA